MKEEVAELQTEIFIRFECGRRGVSDAECRWCGRLIHERDGAWIDGAGRASNDLPGDLLAPDHQHEPAKEEGPTLGPFEQSYLQLTYKSLRHESEVVAYFNEERGDWMIVEPWTGAGETYSDIVIFSGE